MDQTANEIEAHIDRTRDRLGSNLRELEERVDAATDWREHFRNRPQLFLGAAFMGGIVLGHVVRRSTTSAHGVDARRAAGVNGPARAQTSELWSNLQGALIGVASAGITQYIGSLVPGFDEHYRRAEQRTATPKPDPV